MYDCTRGRVRMCVGTVPKAAGRMHVLIDSTVYTTGIVYIV